MLLGVCAVWVLGVMLLEDWVLYLEKMLWRNGVLTYFGVDFCWVGGGMVGVMVGNG